jgi:hypothetical protein
MYQPIARWCPCKSTITKHPVQCRRLQSVVLPGISEAHDQTLLSEPFLQNNKMNTRITLKVRGTVCKPHLVGLHCHKVFHGELLLGDGAPRMVLSHQKSNKFSAEPQAHGHRATKSRAGKRMRPHLDVALDEPPLKEQPRLLRQDWFLRHLTGDFR